MDNTDLDIIVYEGVYPPAEDSYLLMDTIEIDDSDVVLEIGCGAGLVTTAVAKVASRVVATDISRLALENTKRNLKTNTAKENWSLLQADLLSSLNNARVFSVIMFNPPYLPKGEKRTSLDHTFIGGQRGIEVTVEFLKQAKQRISEKGEIYTIGSSLADVQGMIDSINALGLRYEIVEQKSMFFEKLLLLRIASR